MLSILGLLDKYVFGGIPSDAAWDLLKGTWEKANARSWEDLYLDAFDSALSQERPRLAKYADGEISLDRETLRRILHYDLIAPVPTMGLAALAKEEFVGELAAMLAERQALVIGGHNLSHDDYAQVIRTLVRKATATFKSSVLQNQAAFQRAMLSEAVDDAALLGEMQTYLKQRFDIMLQQLDQHTTLLQQVVANTEIIKKGLGLDRPQEEIRAEIQTSIDTKRPALFDVGGLCSGRLLTPATDQFFVAQEFSEDRDDLLNALGGALARRKLKPYRADQDVESGHILCKIAAKIQTTLFSVFELTKTQNRNVYLELGMAIGLRRPFVLVKEVDAEVSPLAQGLDYYAIRSYAGMRRELGDRLRQYLLDITRFHLTDFPAPGSSETYVIVHGDYDMPPDFCLAIATGLADRGLTPVLLGNDNREVADALEFAGIGCEVIGGLGDSRLAASVKAIQSAHFGVYRVDPHSSADAFLLLGVAMGLNRPWHLVSREGNSLPADVRGLSGLEFRDFGNLERHISKIISR